MSELTFTEEILLLLDDHDGSFLPTGQYAFEPTLAGAVLMDLAFMDRIDTDLQSLFVISQESTDNDMLDGILAKIEAGPAVTDTQEWIRLLSVESVSEIREHTLSSLVEKGVLRREEKRFLGLFRNVRYLTLDDSTHQEIRARIKSALEEDIPEPRDIALITLADACQILPDLLRDQEIEREKITQLRKMDLIGRTVTSTVADIQRSIALTARTQLLRTKRLMRWLSLATAAGIAVILLAPRITAPDRFGTSFVHDLWLNGPLQVWSGHTLVALAIVLLIIGVAIGKRLITGFVSLRRWRLAHVAIGLLCVFVLFLHTGFRLGSNANAVLMGLYLALLLIGALTGILFGSGQGQKWTSFFRTARVRRTLRWLHVVVILPLPALLVVHVLAALLF